MSINKQNILEHHYRWHDSLLTPIMAATDILQKCASSRQLRQRCTWEFWHNYWKNRPNSYKERNALIFRMISRTKNDKYNKEFLRGSMILSFDIHHKSIEDGMMNYPMGKLMAMSIINGHTEFIKLLILQGIEMDISHIFSYIDSGSDISIFLPYFKKDDIKNYIEEDFKSIIWTVRTYTNPEQFVGVVRLADEEIVDRVQRKISGFIKRINFCVKHFGKDILNSLDGNEIFIYIRVYNYLRYCISQFQSINHNQQLFLEFNITTSLNDFYTKLIQ